MDTRVSTGMVMQIARPLGSPRITPQKRVAPVGLDDLDASATKCTKRSSETTPPECLKDTELDQKKVPELVDLDEAVKRAISFYKELFILQTIEEECGYPQDEVAREDRSGLACEEWAKERYEAIRSAVDALLPWAGGVEPAGPGANYDVLEFQGEKPAGLKKDPYAKRKTAEEKAQIWDYRDSSKLARAREALVTVCSALSCRKEKLWVEFSESKVMDVVKKSGFRRVKSQKMVELITRYIDAEFEKGHWSCQFACALVRAESYIRIAFGRGIDCSIPASILIVHRMPLWNVFLKMEGDTPFVGIARQQSWWKNRGRQVAFQELNLAIEDPDERNERLPASTLKPDPQLKALLQGRTHVVYLDMLASLSTREASKKYGLTDIVKAELATLFREAKAKGEAVIFVLAAEEPRTLAEKVYLRPPLNEWGLKCGCFRWRASPEAPWARETEYSNRTTFMLQMP